MIGNPISKKTTPMQIAWAFDETPPAPRKRWQNAVLMTRNRAK
jgi:hypothetical protein